MDMESEKVLKLIFPDGVPENLRNDPELFNYLEKLGSYKVKQLKKEQSRLADETKNIIEQTQDLAISNYKTFISTAENARSTFQEFHKAEAQVDKLNENIPQFIDKCEKFLNESSEINDKRRLNTITLKKHGQLLEILELPQLMERCIREGRYEEALELASYAQRMDQNQGHLPVIKDIVSSMEALWESMLLQLVAQLPTDLQLPKCLQIVGYLRRMQAFDNAELKLKFLQARDTWYTAQLEAIPKDDTNFHLTKTIELTRVNLFNIITQYRAIFPEEEGPPATMPSLTKTLPLQSVSSNGNGERLFYAWLHKKLKDFLATLEEDLYGVDSIDNILGLCMYFGYSFSRVCADFRALMCPIFVKVIRHNFTKDVAQATRHFEREMEKYTLINKVTIHSRLRSATDMGDNSISSTLATDSYAPPEPLLDFHPLASLCNGYLNGFNKLRLCCPVAVATSVTHCLRDSLKLVAINILTFYRQEQQAFTSNEREVFTKFCSCFAYDLIPYIQRCIHALFPREQLVHHLGISLLELEQQQITYLQQAEIIEPLKHLLPTKVDVLVMSQQERSKPSVGVAVESPLIEAGSS